MVCTTPSRCGAPALHTKGPRCIGRPDGKDDCDCLNACGDDPWIESGRSMPCDHRRETQARIAALTTAAPAAVAGPSGDETQKLPGIVDKALNDLAGFVKFLETVNGSWNSRTARNSLRDIEWFARRKLAAAMAAPQPASQGNALDAEQHEMDAKHAAIYRWMLGHVADVLSILDNWLADEEADTDELHDALAARAAQEGK